MRRPSEKKESKAEKERKALVEALRRAAGDSNFSGENVAVNEATGKVLHGRPMRYADPPKKDYKPLGEVLGSLPNLSPAPANMDKSFLSEALALARQGKLPKRLRTVLPSKRVMDDWNGFVIACSKNYATAKRHMDAAESVGQTSGLWMGLPLARWVQIAETERADIAAIAYDRIPAARRQS